MNALNRSHTHYPATRGVYVFLIIASFFVLTQAGCISRQPLEISRTPETQSTQAPTTPIPNTTIILVPESAPPALIYVVGSQIMKLNPGEEARQVAEVPEAGSVLSALQSGETLLILREGGLQRLSLADGFGKMVLRFDSPLRFGDLILAGDGDQVLVSAVSDDPAAEFGWRTTVGIHSLNDDSVRVLLSSPQNLRVLGLTPDRLGLYLLPVGQDPDFGSLLQVELEKGEVERELLVYGSLFAALSPDGRFVATLGPESTLNLYDLTASPPEPLTYALPEAPSYIASLSWSPDGHSLYFLLNPGSVWDAPVRSHGLWRLDIASGDILPIAAVSEAAMHIRTLSPDGGWLLLEHESQLDAVWINLSSGESLPFDRPGVAALVARMR